MPIKPTTGVTGWKEASGECAVTVVELLVVMGTLAVLALLLAPALASTRMESWRPQCQNNPSNGSWESDCFTGHVDGEAE